MSSKSIKQIAFVEDPGFFKKVTKYIDDNKKYDFSDRFKLPLAETIYYIINTSNAGWFIKNCDVVMLSNGIEFDDDVYVLQLYYDNNNIQFKDIKKFIQNGDINNMPFSKMKVTYDEDKETPTGLTTDEIITVFNRFQSKYFTTEDTNPLQAIIDETTKLAPYDDMITETYINLSDNIQEGSIILKFQQDVEFDEFMIIIQNVKAKFREF